MNSEEQPDSTSDQEEPPTSEPETPRHHVALIQTVERQVGEHVLSALQEDGAVAALTTLVPGVRNDRVVSIPLTSDQIEAIRDILQVAHSEAAEANDEDQGRREGFLGFHTVLRLEDEQDAAEEQAEG
ncbi:MAG: hypothetical protein GY894_11325 [Planctomycetes bacterium]|jgi:hypothetical protein|nr:hypothetical protein [Planctomycetota bacterium]MCP4839927.1 hypothetical protein [Planctomycetota bacterium]